MEAIRVGQQLQDSSQRSTGAHQGLREGGRGGEVYYSSECLFFFSLIFQHMVYSCLNVLDL